MTHDARACACESHTLRVSSRVFTAHAHELLASSSGLYLGEKQVVCRLFVVCSLPVLRLSPGDRGGNTVLTGGKRMSEEWMRYRKTFGIPKKFIRRCLNNKI